MQAYVLNLVCWLHGGSCSSQEVANTTDLKYLSVQLRRGKLDTVADAQPDKLWQPKRAWETNNGFCLFLHMFHCVLD